MELKLVYLFTKNYYNTFISSKILYFTVRRNVILSLLAGL
jgi:hypothetical protein